MEGLEAEVVHSSRSPSLNPTARAAHIIREEMVGQRFKSAVNTSGKNVRGAVAAEISPPTGIGHEKECQ
jgi:hypothetical protein